MIDILVRPGELRTTAEQFRLKVGEISQALKRIDQIMLSIKGDRFLGLRADAVQKHYAPKREALLKASNVVAKFATDLEKVAVTFEKADSLQKKARATNSSLEKNTPTDTFSSVSSPNNSRMVKKVKDTIHDMNVVGNSRYARQSDGRTFCNIFVMDFCKKLGVPLPEYLDWNMDGRIDDYLNANEAFQWLKGTYARKGVQTGPELGWKIVSDNKAAQLASQGKVVVAGWQNPKASEPGHLAIIRPESTKGNIQIAQAGWTNFEKGPIEKGFGARTITYFVYDP